MKTKVWSFVGTGLCLSLCVAFSSCSKEQVKQSSNSVNAEVQQDNLNTKGLVAWYPFDGDVLDHSGNGNDVIFNNATPVAGRKGIPNTAFQFNGKSNFMKVANSSSIRNFPNGITLVAVVKPEGFYMGPCHGNFILFKGKDVNVNGNYLLAFDDQKYYGFNGCDQPVATQFENFYGSFGDGPFQSLGAVSDTYIKLKWYKIIYTCDNATGKLYINGELRGTKVNESFSFTPNSESLFIGKTKTEGFPYPFNGIIDDIKIYNRALNIQEVQQLSNQ